MCDRNWASNLTHAKLPIMIRKKKSNSIENYSKKINKWQKRDSKWPKKHTKRNTPFLRSEETDPHISAPGMTANAGRAVTKGTLPGDGGGSGNRHGVLEMKTGRFH